MVWIFGKKLQRDIVENEYNEYILSGNVCEEQRCLQSQNWKSREVRSPVKPLKIEGKKCAHTDMENGCWWVFGGQRLNKDFPAWCLWACLTPLSDNEAWHNSYWFTNTVIKKMHVSRLSRSLFLVLSIVFTSFAFSLFNIQRLSLPLSLATKAN